MMRAWYVLVLNLLVFLGPGNVWSQEPISRAGISVGKDSGESRYSDVAVSLGFESGTLLLNGGASRYRDDNSDSDFVSRHFGLGYVFLINDLIDVTPRVTRWGSNEALISQSLYFDLVFTTDNWRFGVEPQWQRLIWEKTDSETKIRTQASGVHFRLNYLGIENWQFGVTFGGNNYGGEAFEDFLFSANLTEYAFMDGVNLAKSYAGLSVSYYLSAWTFFLSTRTSRSIIEEVETRNVGLSIEYQINESWDIGVELGSSRSDKNESITSTGLTAGFTW